MWVVTKPRPESGYADILFEAETPMDLVIQIRGGLGVDEIDEIYKPCEYEAAQARAWHLLDERDRKARNSESVTRTLLLQQLEQLSMTPERAAALVELYLHTLGEGAVAVAWHKIRGK